MRYCNVMLIRILRSTAFLALIANLFSFQQGCRSRTQSNDESDVLIRHLLNRENSLTEALQKSQRQTLEHDNACLEDQLAILRGGTPRRSKEKFDPAGRAIQNLDLMVQNLLDAQAAIDLDKRNHPSVKRLTAVRDTIKELCGECLA